MDGKSDFPPIDHDGDEDQAEAVFDPERAAQSFAACSWQAMSAFDETDPEGYLKLSALSRKLRYGVIDQMTGATDAPHAVAVTTFAVEFMTMFLAKIVDTARDVPVELARKAGIHDVSDAELFGTFTQGLMEMCKQLYDAGNERAKASDEADKEEVTQRVCEEVEEMVEEDSKIIAFVPS